MLNYAKLVEKRKFNIGNLLLFTNKDNCTLCCNSLFTCFTDISVRTIKILYDYSNDVNLIF
jgi:hypothetical protein